MRPATARVVQKVVRAVVPGLLVTGSLVLATVLGGLITDWLGV